MVLGLVATGDWCGSGVGGDRGLVWFWGLWQQGTGVVLGLVSTGDWCGSEFGGDRLLLWF